MVAKCANPACSKPFRYLHEGRLFIGVLSDSDKVKFVKAVKDSGVEYAWLCQQCAATLVLHFDAGQGFRVVPRKVGAMQSKTAREGLSGVA